ncbi:Clo7bot family Cys-rich peptide [Clostridium botulinum]|nr:Clo7bot family Cys-rich peptide [Clostridium botulinum]NFB20361.1 Clo7bot family Cys-rich peptide [Clostridium botulinum]NFI39383.1 Clo7bot family Cys-rich peptide [Clostridium botulinum]NFT56050.1 Clo7bot family Cys-rich peptide [Clostridium botulinum]
MLRINRGNNMKYIIRPSSNKNWYCYCSDCNVCVNCNNCEVYHSRI